MSFGGVTKRKEMKNSVGVDKARGGCDDETLLRLECVPKTVFMQHGGDCTCIGGATTDHQHR